jgi:hypothetical protein
MTLDDAQRATLAALADTVVPGGEGLPSASGANVHGKWIDRVLAVRPDLAAAVLSVVERGELPLDEAELAAAFSRAVTGAYLMNPKVCKLLGLPGNAPKPRPALSDESDYYLEDGVLEPVLARGPIFRPTPEVSA